jgi:hypothetical protein
MVVQVINSSLFYMKNIILRLPSKAKYLILLLFLIGAFLLLVGKEQILLESKEELAFSELQEFIPTKEDASKNQGIITDLETLKNEITKDEMVHLESQELMPIEEATEDEEIIVEEEVLEDEFTKEKEVALAIGLTPKEQELIDLKLDIKNEIKDFEQLGDYLRVFKTIHEDVWLNAIPSRIMYKQIETIELLDDLDSKIFPWLKPLATSTIQLRKSFKGSGIVICVGNHHTKMAVATIKMIRQVYNSLLPVEVFYTGENDLSPSNRAKFEAIPFTKTIDIVKLLDNSILNLKGWAIKPFAILASSFEKTMLIDADVVFLQSPQTLFDSQLFMDKGALFYHDRSLYKSSEETRKWFYELMPKPPSAYSQTLRIFQGKTGHEQESGVVLINKRETLVGLLATCTLNVGPIRDQSYKKVYGDKETFWLGYEIVQASYIFSPFFPGAAGVSEISESGLNLICAIQLMHVDEDLMPVWVNGGIAVSKVEKNSTLAPLEEYIIEPGKWIFSNNRPPCIESSQSPIKFTKEISISIKDCGKVLLDERKQ